MEKPNIGERVVDATYDILMIAVMNPKSEVVLGSVNCVAGLYQAVNGSTLVSMWSGVAAAVVGTAFLVVGSNRLIRGDR